MFLFPTSSCKSEKPKTVRASFGKARKTGLEDGATTHQMNYGKIRRENTSIFTQNSPRIRDDDHVEEIMILWRNDNNGTVAGASTGLNVLDSNSQANMNRIQKLVSESSVNNIELPVHNVPHSTKLNVSFKLEWNKTIEFQPDNNIKIADPLKERRDFDSEKRRFQKNCGVAPRMIESIRPLLYRLVKLENIVFIDIVPGSKSEAKKLEESRQSQISPWLRLLHREPLELDTNSWLQDPNHVVKKIPLVANKINDMNENMIVLDDTKPARDVIKIEPDVSQVEVITISDDDEPMILEAEIPRIATQKSNEYLSEPNQPDWIGEAIWRRASQVVHSPSRISHNNRSHALRHDRSRSNYRCKRRVNRKKRQRFRRRRSRDYYKHHRSRSYDSI
uniref:Uncharacterized protein n=1 Tax=Acrobeloides nanus TaxID=290746 RepID=A0A914CCQ8_9BILA